MKHLVLVETISLHTMRYVVEVEDDPLHALDAVTLEETDEISQKWLGETIVSHRVIDEDEYIRVFDENNDYLRSWSDEDKKKYIHRIDYSI